MDPGRGRSLGHAIAIIISALLIVNRAETLAGTLAGTGALAVQYDGGLVTIVANDIPLETVLAAMGQAAGFQVSITGDLGPRISRSFAGKPLIDALRELAGGNSMVIILAPESDRAKARQLRQLWVLGTSRETRSDQAGMAARETTGDPMDAIRSLSRAGRLGTVAELGATGDARSVDLLNRMAANDEDATVRSQAIEGLGGIRGQDATLALGRIVIGSTDPDLRWMAVRALAERDSGAARAFLERAAQDPDDWVRDEALRALDFLNYQAGN
ncbi:MAG: HEAT repeat domain-containing protein [Sphingomonadales bacterium]